MLNKIQIFVINLNLTWMFYQIRMYVKRKQQALDNHANPAPKMVNEEFRQINTSYDKLRIS